MPSQQWPSSAHTVHVFPAELWAVLSWTITVCSCEELTEVVVCEIINFTLAITHLQQNMACSQNKKVTDCRTEQMESFVHRQSLQLNYLSFAHEITTWTGDILWQKSQVQWSVSTWNIATHVTKLCVCTVCMTHKLSEQVSAALKWPLCTTDFITRAKFFSGWLLFMKISNHYKLW